MDNDIKKLLLIYVLPICLISLGLVLFAPPMLSVGALGMISLGGLVMIGMAFLVDHLDK